MGGKGRGVFSDFRLGRVRDRLYCFKDVPDRIAVPIPNKRAGWQLARCEEGELVKRRQTGVLIICILLQGDMPHWAAFAHGMSYGSTITCHSRRPFRDPLLLLRALSHPSRPEPARLPTTQTSTTPQWIQNTLTSLPLQTLHSSCKHDSSSRTIDKQDKARTRLTARTVHKPTSCSAERKPRWRLITNMKLTSRSLGKNKSYCQEAQR
jgi:hypothetical protein